MIWIYCFLIFLSSIGFPDNKIFVEEAIIAFHN